MMNIGAQLQVVGDPGVSPEEAAEQRLDALFFALSDPVRRRILERLDGQALLVSELAAPFDISLQAVSRHIQVLVRAGLIQQERSGRISRCSLDAGPLLDAAVWMNRYSKYWQQQFELLAATLAEIDARRPERAAKRPAGKRTRTRGSRRTSPRRDP
jgi:DNA-binding transcriptional ArsR family regulator